MKKMSCHSIVYAVIALFLFMMAGCGGSSSGPSNPSNPQSNSYVYVTDWSGTTVDGYSVDSSTGSLTKITGSPFTAGTSPFTIAIHPNGKFAYVGNSSSDNVSAFSIDGSTGVLTELSNSPFSAGSSPFAIAVHPSGKFLYVANLVSDDVSAYSVDTSTGDLTPIAGSPFSSGNGARSLTMDSSGLFLYVANEFDNTVTGFSISSVDGSLTAVPGSPFSVATNGGSAPRSVAIEPSDSFLYVANRATDNVSAFSLNISTGALTEISGSPFSVALNGGDGSRSLAVDPAGNFLYVANEFSADVSVLAIDSGGALTEISGSPYATGTPGTNGSYTVAVDSSGAFLYVTNNSANDVSAFTVDAVTGALTAISGSPFSTGTGPAGIAVATVTP